MTAFLHHYPKTANNVGIQIHNNYNFPSNLHNNLKRFPTNLASSSDPFASLITSITQDQDVVDLNVGSKLFDAHGDGLFHQFDFPSLLSSFETFDGSTLPVDTVIVSNVFWASLKAKILTLIIGQFLASVVFSFLVYIFAAQFQSMLQALLQKLPSIFMSNMEKIENDYKKYDRSASRSNVNRYDNVSSTQNSQQQQQQQLNTQEAKDINIDIPKLFICLTIDTLGTSSEFIPFVGEITDLAYAPFASLLFKNYLFPGSNVVFALEFVEEILPFTDILPLATICWVVDTFFRDSDLAKLLQLGEFSTIAKNYNEQENFGADLTTSNNGSQDLGNNALNLVKQKMSQQEEQTKKNGKNNGVIDVDFTRD